MAKELTERQKSVLQAIREWIKEHGYPPTIRELGQRLGIKSLRGVTSHLDALARKGQLSRKRSARGIRILVDSPSGAVEITMRVPILGRIAAGKPLLAEEQVEGQLVIDASLLGKVRPENPASHFALKVKGESMQGAGILDGDYVVVRQQPTAENGEIIAAQLGDEATIKRFFKERDKIRLQPDHPTMEPILVEKPQHVEVLGKVVAVFRKLD